LYLWFLGIDVSKVHLDVAFLPNGEGWAVTNDEVGIAAVAGRLKGSPPASVVLEATGGVELQVTGALAAAGLPVVVNPRQVRELRQSHWKTGQDRCPGRPGSVAVWRGRAAGIASAAGYVHAGAAGFVDPPPSIGGDAGG